MKCPYREKESTWYFFFSISDSSSSPVTLNNVEWTGLVSEQTRQCKLLCDANRFLHCQLNSLKTPSTYNKIVSQITIKNKVI